ncbi:hypothetical protein [Edaphobacter bradus]|uniref:hypothetical protein n=1 Tax=Edaphobacter bradus TaxID=2259016 RepID=UPI0021DF4962|nr:hypothetical protein [Edaphobacter bradus]
MPKLRSTFALTLSAALLAPVALTGCSRPAAQSASPTLASSQQAALNAARQQLELIPPPAKSRYMAVHSLDTWENPYLTVQGSMVTLHVLLADANASSLGQGSILRPVGARRRNLDVRLSDLPTALNAIPESSWPYGRVIAIEEAHETPASARPVVRRNMEAVIKTLNDLGVVVYDWSTANGTQG